MAKSSQRPSTRFELARAKAAKEERELIKVQDERLKRLAREQKERMKKVSKPTKRRTRLGRAPNIKQSQIDNATRNLFK